MPVLLHICAPEPEPEPAEAPEEEVQKMGPAVPQSAAHVPEVEDCLQVSTWRLPMGLCACLCV